MTHQSKTFCISRYNLSNWISSVFGLTTVPEWSMHWSSSECRKSYFQPVGNHDDLLSESRLAWSSNALSLRLLRGICGRGYGAQTTVDDIKPYEPNLTPLKRGEGSVLWSPPRACLPLQCPGHMTKLTAVCTIRHNQISVGGVLETIPALWGYVSVYLLCTCDDVWWTY